MKLYRVSRTGSDKAVWCGTQADVSAAKKVMMEDGAKRKDISVEDVDVPTSKAELITWLQENCAHVGP